MTTALLSTRLLNFHGTPWIYHDNPWKKCPWKKKPGIFGHLVLVENDWEMSLEKAFMEKTLSIWTPCSGGKGLENIHGKSVHGKNLEYLDSLSR
jgi:hypothetical protein